MFGSDWRESNRKRKSEEERIRQLIASGFLKPPTGASFRKNEKGLYDTVNPADKAGPETVTPGMSLVGGDGKLKEKPKLYKVWDPVKKIWVREETPEGYSGIEYANPPSDPTPKETPEQGGARDILKSVLQWQMDYPDKPLPAALQKTADSVLPSIGYEAVEEPGKAITNWRGKPTGEKEPGLKYYRLKGSPGGGGETKTRRQNPKTKKWWVYTPKNGWQPE